MSVLVSTLKQSERLAALFAVVFLLTAYNTSAQPFPSPPPSPSPAASLAASPIPLDGWLTSASLWQTTPDHFPEAQSLGFRWTSDAHDAARAAGRGLQLGRVPVAEAIARFSTEKTQPAEPTATGAAEAAVPS